MKSSYKPIPKTNVTVPMRNISGCETGNAQQKAIRPIVNRFEHAAMIS